MLARLRRHVYALDVDQGVEEVSARLLEALDDIKRVSSISVQLRALRELLTPSTSLLPLGILPCEVGTHSMASVTGRMS